MKKVHTEIELPVGALFGILGSKKLQYELDETVLLWSHKEQGTEITYAKGIITSIPKNLDGTYECEVVDLLNK